MNRKWGGRKKNFSAYDHFDVLYIYKMKNIILNIFWAAIASKLIQKKVTRVDFCSKTFTQFLPDVATQFFSFFFRKWKAHERSDCPRGDGQIPWKARELEKKRFKLVQYDYRSIAFRRKFRACKWLFQSSQTPSA